MIKPIVELYCIIFDKEKQKYQVLSEHSETFIVLSKEITQDTKSIIDILSSLIDKYILVSADYIKFIHLESTISDGKIIIPYFCLIPYNLEIKDCYKHYTEDLINDFPILRKITNIA